MDNSLPASTSVGEVHIKRRWLHRPTDTTLLAASALLAFVVSAIMVCAYWPLMHFILASHGTRFEIVQQGMPTWYEVGWTNIRAVSGPAGYEDAPVHVLEAVSFESPVGDRAVLAQVPGTEDVILGVLHADNTFTTVFTDPNPKANLGARPDGVAVFSTVENGVSHIAYVSLTTPGKSSDLGSGSNPRLNSDGFFVAVSPQGLVRIDPALNASSSSVLVPNSYAEKLFGTISPDGKLALLPNAAAKMTLYSIEKTSPAKVPVTQTKEQIFLGPTGFLRGGYIVELGSGAFRIHALTNNQIHSIGPLTVN